MEPNDQTSPPPEKSKSGDIDDGPLNCGCLLATVLVVTVFVIYFIVLFRDGIVPIQR